jgi:hypothetical protein
MAGRLETTAATAALTAALLAASPTPWTAMTTLRSAGSAPEPGAPVVALAAVIAWSLAAWLLLVAAGSLAARRPGAGGRTAAAVTRRVAPVGVRRRVEVALGLSVAVALAGAGPAAAGPALPPAPPSTAVPFDWPAAASDPAPGLDWNPGSPGPPVPAATAVTASVVVQPGDSLWTVAADHLPAGTTNARIAQAWPSWWAANRAAVGADPDLIHPGLQLRPPTHPPVNA